MVFDNGSWDWSRLGDVVPSHIILQISIIMPLSPKASQDCLDWKWMKRYVFSFAETYRKLVHIEDTICLVVWSLIWKERSP